MAQIINVSDGSFEQDVLKSDVPVLVEFWAQWCGPCKQIAPLIKNIAEEYDGRLTVAKMDIDQNPEYPAKYGVRGIPALFLVKDGAVIAQKVGALARGQLQSFIENNI